jgi:nucleoside-diphosphate-sugar epimerase
MLTRRVLVTGGSGFLAAHCIRQLIERGYEVRTTVRSPEREPQVRKMLASGVGPAPTLEFHSADLTRDDGWNQAVAGCDFVLHVASPFPLEVPRNEDDLVVPARDGALRVLRASRDAGVKRVVLTSSFATIAYGRGTPRTAFTESDWTDPAGADVSPYIKSKTVAERTAWEFVEREGGDLEMTAVNPVGILGPVLGPDYASSIQLVQRLLDGSVPGCPKLTFAVVDVRDVADAHIRAMELDEARHERFLLAADGVISMREIAEVLRDELGDVARRAPRHEIPNWVVRLAALRDKPMRQIVPDLGKVRLASNAKARSVLGWSPRSKQEAVIATAESLIRLGIVPSP